MRKNKTNHHAVQRQLQNLGFAAGLLALAPGLMAAPAQAPAPVPARPAADASTVVPGRILIMPRAGLSEEALASIVKAHGAGASRRLGSQGLRLLELPAGTEAATAERLSRNPHIKFAEVDRRVRHELATNDPYLGSEWHLQKVGAPAAWDSSLGSGITIAILDTGVDASHPDLAGSLVPGRNVYDGNTNTADVYGHGTKVAGSAAAAANNGQGVAGVAGAAKIMPVRVSDTTGSATYSAIAQGLTWAADNGAKVANISYVVAGSSAVISAAQYMKSKGGLVTTSAGNYGTDAGIAATTSMIVVSATDSNDALAGWSSFGSFVSLSAPGVGIYTTVSGGGYGSASGTSFSAPITAGAVALMMSVKPALSNTTVEKLLFSTALDLGAAGRDVYFGYGRLDASAAVAAALNAAATMDTSAPTAAIASPSGGATVSGMVTIDATATDNVGVTKVELWVDGALASTDVGAPYGFTWDTSKVANGQHSLVARAYDGAGNATSSATVTVGVANAVLADITPPSVQILSPLNSTVVSGTRQVSVSANDNSGAAAIKQTLFINGKQVASATGSTLNYSWNTRKVASGSYTLTAVAKDAAGNSTSQTVTVSK
jgi:subtilisin family serine protease